MMPLRRVDDICDLENLVGVTFAMIDEALNKRVTCRVTFEALCDRASFDGDDNNWMGAWKRHMGEIETYASANYDSGKPLVGGHVIVDTHVLTPLSHGKSYYQSRG